MPHRTDKLEKAIDRIQFALTFKQAAKALSLCLHRGVCPKCGETILRQGSVLACSDPGCDGISEAQERVRTYAVAKNL